MMLWSSSQMSATSAFLLGLIISMFYGYTFGVKNCLEERERLAREGSPYVNISGPTYIELPGIRKKCTEVEVWCDMETDGGGWTVFQNRFDGSLEFSNSVTDSFAYLMGFGSSSSFVGGKPFESEHYLGNKWIYRLSEQAPQELYVKLEDEDGNKAYAHYKSFKMVEGDYELRHLADVISIGSLTVFVANYSGTAGDSLSYVNGQPFSTAAADNDGQRAPCGQWWGPWWYGPKAFYKEYCSPSNLNGLYKGKGDGYDMEGIYWHSFTGFKKSLKATKMMMRPNGEEFDRDWNPAGLWCENDTEEH